MPWESSTTVDANGQTHAGKTKWSNDWGGLKKMWDSSIGGMFRPVRTGWNYQSYTPDSANFDLPYQQQIAQQNANAATRAQGNQTAFNALGGSYAAKAEPYGQQQQAARTASLLGYGSDYGGGLSGANRLLDERTAQDYGRASSAYGSMDRQLATLEQAQQGNAPSVAQIQQQQGLDRALANQMAAAQSGPGGFNAATQAAAMRQGADVQRQSVSDAAALRAQEIAAARGQTSDFMGQRYSAAQNLGALSGNQIGQYQAQGGLGLQGVQAMQNQQQIDAAQQGQQYGQSNQMYGLGLQYGTQNLQSLQGITDIAKAQQQGRMGYEELGAQQNQSQNQLALENAKANQEAKAGNKGGLMGAAGSLLGKVFSDERTKEQIRVAEVGVQAARSEQELQRAFADLRRAQADWDRKSGGPQNSSLSSQLDQAAARDYQGEWAHALGDDGLAGQLAAAEQRSMRGLDGRASLDPRELGVPKERRLLTRAPSLTDRAAEVAPIEFRYRQEARSASPAETRPGTQVGVLAQDLERSGLGHVVERGSDGMRRIDPATAATTGLAIGAANARRIQALEKSLDGSAPTARFEDDDTAGFEQAYRDYQDQRFATENPHAGPGVARMADLEPERARAPRDEERTAVVRRGLDAIEDERAMRGEQPGYMRQPGKQQTEASKGPVMLGRGPESAEQGPNYADYARSKMGFSRNRVLKPDFELADAMADKYGGDPADYERALKRGRDATPDQGTRQSWGDTAGDMMSAYGSKVAASGGRGGSRPLPRIGITRRSY